VLRHAQAVAIVDPTCDQRLSRINSGDGIYDISLPRKTGVLFMTMLLKVTS